MKKTKKLNKLSLGGKMFLVVFFIIFLIYGFSLTYPLLWALINAGKTSVEYFENSFGLPDTYLFRNFVDVFKNFVVGETGFLVMLWNTTWMAAMNTIANVSVSTMTAYVIARYNFPGRNVLFYLAVAVQIIPIVGSGVSSYKFYHDIGLLNNPALYWLVWAGGFSFAFIVLYGYFKSISREYEEAAIMDGCSNWKLFIKIMVPMAKPSIIALMILDVISMWNDYNTSLFYMKDYPQIGLGIYMFQAESTYLANSMPTLFAAIVITILPILIVFSFTQDIIMTNVTAGGLKG